MAQSSACRSPRRFGILHDLLSHLRLRPAGSRPLQSRPRFRPRLEALEDRVVPAGSFQNLAASGTAPPDGGAAMMVLSNGSILIQDGLNTLAPPGQSASFFTLSPQTNTGSYVNGAFAGTGSMNEKRLFFPTAMLPDGRVFAVGGEYPKFSNTAEIYDPTTGVWSYVDPFPAPFNTNVDLSGTITAASNASPIVITTASTQQLQNGMQVTISGVGGNTNANGTFTVSNVTATTFQLNGSTGNGAYTSGGTWNAFAPQFGDDPVEVLSTGPNKGQILAGYFFASPTIPATTFRFNPAAAPGTQWTQTAGNKLRNDQSDEESWVKLKDGSILSYDVFASASSGTFHAQRYIPATDTWVDASNLNPLNPPSVLSGNAQGSELGPAFLQPDGNVIYFGANGNTAIYNPTTNVWSAGFNEPTANVTVAANGTITAGGGPTSLVATDDPGAVLPNGHILIALSPLGGLFNGAYNFPNGFTNATNGTYLYEYDPTAATFAAAWTNVTPSVIRQNAFQLNMVVLPTGQVLMSTEGAGFQVYTEDPATGPQNAWRPTISNIVFDGGNTYTLTGTQLNGISEGSNYGDDNQSASNYPILQFKDAGGNVFYGRTFNWSSTSVVTGATPVSVQFTLPVGETLSQLKTVTVIANGIPSAPQPFDIAPNVTPPGTQTSVEGAGQTFNLGSFTDPDGGPWNVDISWGDGTPDTTFSVATAGSLGTQNHTYGEEGPYTVTETVTDTSDSQSGSTTFTVNVSDPAVVATGVAVQAVAGRPFTNVPVATFTDPGGAEPNPSDPGPIATHYTATIDWGDSTPTSNGTITYSGTAGSTTDPFTVTGSHTYAKEGTFTITTTINHEGILTTTTSTATVKDDIGLLLLDPTGFQSLAVTVNGSVSSNGFGAVIVDSSNSRAVLIGGNGVVNAADIDVVGGVKILGKGSTSSPIDVEPATPDPLGLALPAPPAPTFGPVNYVGSAPLTLQPGTYVGGISLRGTGPVTLNPGVYYIKGGGFLDLNQGALTGTGVTIIVTGTGTPTLGFPSFSFSGQGSVNLSAPTSGPFQGITIFQDPADVLPIQFNGSGPVTLNGVVYAPSAPVSISGNANVTILPSPGTAGPFPLYGALIAFDLNVQSSGALSIDPDPSPPFPFIVVAPSAATASSSAGAGVSPFAASIGSPSGGRGVQGDDSPLSQVAISLSRGQQAVGNNPSPAPVTGSSTSTTLARQAVLDELFSGSTGVDSLHKHGVDELFSSLAE